MTTDLLEKVQLETHITVKAAKSLPYGQVEVIVSSSALDRHGETIQVSGINTKRFMENPVVLWAHDYESLPIGKVVKAWKSEGKLMARIQFMTDILPFADVVYQLILAGAINAVSIGGIVQEYGESKGKMDYSNITKMEMIELSVVPVGANPEALITSKSINTDEQTIKSYYEDFVKSAKLESALDNHIKVTRDLLAELEETRKGFSSESIEDSAGTILRKRVLRWKQQERAEQREIVRKQKNKSETLISGLNAELKRIHNERRERSDG